MTKHRNKPRSTGKPAAAPVQTSTNRRVVLAATIGLGLIIVSALGLGWMAQNAASSAAAPVTPASVAALVTPTVVAAPIAPTTVAAPSINPSATATPPTTNPITLTIKRITQLSQLPPGQVERVEVAYFHRTQRCKSCQEAERLTRKTLDTYFTDQMSSGLVNLTTIDVQDPQNTALTRKYGATGSSLFFGIIKNGVEYICPVSDVWIVLNNEAKFLPLLRDKINAALGEG